MSETSGKVFDANAFKRILGYVRPYKGIAIGSVVLTILLAVLAPVNPELTKYALDTATQSNHYGKLLLMCGLLLLFLLIRSGIQFLNTYYTNLLGQNIIKDMRVGLYTHILNLRLQFFDHTPIGMLVTRVNSDIETIADVFSEGLIVMMNQMLTVLVIIIVMLVEDWRLALLSLSVFPILLFATYLFQKATRASFQEVRTQVAKLNTFVQEHITGMSVVQIFNREDIELDKFKQINNDHKVANVRSIWYYSIFFPVVDILSSISVAVIVWWGGRGILYHTISFGTVAEFIMYINMLFIPIRQLSDRFNTLQMGVVSSERIFKVFDTQTFIKDEGKIEVAKVQGEIEFQNVWFAYNDENWVLRDVSFSVKPGQTLAIVGATGAGKSSMINILGRFYEFQKGNILIDGNDLRNYKIDALRKNIAIVLQDVFLFSDTIANNIALYNKYITPGQIQLAAEAIGAAGFINSLPGGYNYNVMERGAMLSAGQRQLVSFIRAYVQNPGILVLDEATSSIDTETERMIQHAIEKLTEHRTSIIIAHRLATIQKADKILVLDHGQVVEQGTHQELLHRNGFYKKLHEIQFEKELKKRA
ncbi:MAG TPA: ABC transporter ATP-binding protein [Bacteroidia bacterium]|nr:ABC transporter ATP-binding protein [Bacteroidia bacterium]